MNQNEEDMTLTQKRIYLKNKPERELAQEVDNKLYDFLGATAEHLGLDLEEEIIQNPSIADLAAVKLTKLFSKDVSKNSYIENAEQKLEDRAYDEFADFVSACEDKDLDAVVKGGRVPRSEDESIEVIVRGSEEEYNTLNDSFDNGLINLSYTDSDAGTRTNPTPRTDLNFVADIRDYELPDYLR